MTAETSLTNCHWRTFGAIAPVTVNMEFQVPGFKYRCSSDELKLHNCLQWHFELQTCDKYIFCWMGWYFVSCLFLNSESRLTSTWAYSIFFWLQCRLCQTCRSKVQACWQWIMAIITLFLKKLNCNHRKYYRPVWPYLHSIFPSCWNFKVQLYCNEAPLIKFLPWNYNYTLFINWCHIFVSIVNCMCKQIKHQNTPQMLNE